MVLGFTGTRLGMSKSQHDAFIDYISQHQPSKFHHGNCIGSDSEAHAAVRFIFPFPECEITTHPCDIPHMQAKWKGDIICEAKPPLKRNMDIVDASEVVFATPTLKKKGGTWFTIQYAIKTHKKIVAILPNGELLIL